MRPALALVLVLASASLESPPARAQEAPPAAEAPHAALHARLEALSQRELEVHAKAALDQARRALEAAEAALTRGAIDESERAARLSDAALSLAERLDALTREQGLLRTVRERRAGLSARRKAAQEALAAEEARLRALSAHKETP